MFNPKDIPTQGLKLRIETYKRMNTTVLMPDDKRFIEARLLALLEELETREEHRDADT